MQVAVEQVRLGAADDVEEGAGGPPGRRRRQLRRGGLRAAPEPEGGRAELDAARVSLQERYSINAIVVAPPEASPTCC